MILGVTGSRHPRSDRLVLRFANFIKSNDVNVLHHGDCVGWDAQCATVASYLGVKVIAHPPNQDANRAFVESDVVLDPRDYLQRNRDIVNASEYMIAAPDGPERTRSGTWATIRYSKKTGVRGVIWLD